MYGAEAGEGAEPAVGSRHDAFAADEFGVADDALRDELRMLDEVAAGIEHAGDQENLVLSADMSVRWDRSLKRNPRTRFRVEVTPQGTRVRGF